METDKDDESGGWNKYPTIIDRYHCHAFVRWTNNTN
jgi:hypothetical protein